MTHNQLDVDVPYERKWEEEEITLKGGPWMGC